MDHKDREHIYQKREDIDRAYRLVTDSELKKFRVVVGESDLFILADTDIKLEIEKILKFYRRQLKEYIHDHPVFAETLEPYPMDNEAPELIDWMIQVTSRVNVGPMAAVAGAIAGIIGRNIPPETAGELIIENGGDIFLRSTQQRIVSIFAGKSSFSNRIGLRIPPQPSGMGICTSAGTVGPSLSLGKADAAVILSSDVALADAAATAMGNLVHGTPDLPKAIDFGRTIPDIQGILLIKDNKMAAWGEINIVPVDS